MSAVHEDVPFSEMMRIEQLERDDAVIDSASRLLTDLVRSGSAAMVRNVLPQAVPWMALLPSDDVDVFMTELSTVARSAADLDNLAQVAVLLTQWRHTAEVHADPMLREILTAEPDGDLGLVPESDL